MIGNINSIETMGLLDGPGIRFVIFLQGCPLRCQFCHNPETWNTNGNKMMSTEELMVMIRKYQPYFKNNGGITVTGGEPLLQVEFVTELFKACQKEHIHTCLDTSGYGDNYEELLKVTDLVMLSIKGFNDKEYSDMTGKDMKNTNLFLDYCKKQRQPMWFRHVIIPNFNDNKENILKLKELASSYNVLNIELLAYHTLGNDKYVKLNLPYRLKDIPDLSQSKLDELKRYL